MYAHMNERIIIKKKECKLVPTTMENNMEDSQKTKIRPAIQSSNSTPRDISEGM
jgi:hypothetical protein